MSGIKSLLILESPGIQSPRTELRLLMRSSLR